MSATVMLNPSGQFHRKPVHGVGAQSSYSDLHHPQQQPHPSQYSDPRPRQSSNSPNPPISHHAPPQPAQQYPYAPRLSTSTSSTMNSSGIQRIPTNSSASLPRRSTSSRSTGTTASATSYVALMRKQKATVWCDRAQHEDPSVLNKKRHDKQRAAMEVAGGRHHTSRISTSSSNPSGASSGGLRGKIRHPGAPKAHAYLGGANMSGAGVPIRLSATEMEGDSSDEDLDSKYGRPPHQRSGSGRSSNGSGARTNSHLGSNADLHPNGLGYVADDQTPVPTHANLNKSDYFDGRGEEDGGTEASEQDFGGIAGLPPSKPRAEQDFKSAEDLKRRGSVDDRAMTMSGQRLFVANPDLSD
ncbi:hypothetical protein BDY17DRAFT_154336 [Neohortaea acidophila]|uniref:Uncharacterized protein n=1 Tax=Neohortaea acidophila TaxID=245834 RepID=A0A6A6PVK1_9PEZI|nr:uncharacterized protein BDY17DRAFT_154336 [Neohortaea acidophila]KAF2483764.1 hypothetical protein BDY17DRAFT_154336 [Neohortaea acidophila]